MSPVIGPSLSLPMMPRVRIGLETPLNPSYGTCGPNDGTCTPDDSEINDQISLQIHRLQCLMGWISLDLLSNLSDYMWSRPSRG